MSEENNKVEEISTTTPKKTTTTRKNATKKVASSTKKATTPKPKTESFMDKAKRKTEESHTMEDYTLEDGTDIKFYPVFPNTKIQELLTETQVILQQVNELEIDFTDFQLNKHVLFLCIKHFTDKKDEFSDQFNEQLGQMNILIDAGYYEEIINEVFPQSEILKVNKKMAEMRAQYEFLANLETSAKENLEQLELKQKEMFNALSKENIQQKIENKYK